jgi:cytochrome c oxidase subunit 4
VGTFFVVFALLVGLLALTVAAAEVDLGRWSFVAALVIAAAKAALVVLYFMHVRYSPRLVWLAAAAGFFWLSIMVALALSDYTTRDWP